MGYTCWGCIDLVSLSTGEMAKRYGMVYVDMDNEGNGSKERRVKDSYHWYRKVIASNGGRPGLISKPRRATIVLRGFSGDSEDCGLPRCRESLQSL